MKICECGTENIDKAVFFKNSGKKMPLKPKERSGVLCSHCQGGKYMNGNNIGHKNYWFCLPQE